MPSSARSRATLSPTARGDLRAPPRRPRPPRREARLEHQLLGDGWPAASARAVLGSSGSSSSARRRVSAASRRAALVELLARDALEQLGGAHGVAARRARPARRAGASPRAPGSCSRAGRPRGGAQQLDVVAPGERLGVGHAVPELAARASTAPRPRRWRARPRPPRRRGRTPRAPSAGRRRRGSGGRCRRRGGRRRGRAALRRGAPAPAPARGAARRARRAAGRRPRPRAAARGGTRSGPRRRRRRGARRPPRGAPRAARAGRCPEASASISWSSRRPVGEQPQQSPARRCESRSIRSISASRSVGGSEPRPSMPGGQQLLGEQRVALAAGEQARRAGRAPAARRGCR